MNKKSGVVLICMLMVIATTLPVAATINMNKTETTLHVRYGSDTTTVRAGDIHYVGGSGPGNFTTIQDGIDASQIGDTVFVYDDSSPYLERIGIGKTITLLGENRETTIIDGGGGYTNVHTVLITALQVNISGFTICGGRDEQQIGMGLSVYADHTTISNTIIADNDIGIYDYYGRYTVVTGNVIVNNSRSGIYLETSGNIIVNNTFINDSLCLWGFHTNTIMNNIVNGKSLVYLENRSHVMKYEVAGQIILVQCTDISIQHQEISHASIGIELIRCTGCTLSENTLSNNSMSGILLYESDNNSIVDNTLAYNGRSYSSNDGGITVYYSDDNIVSSNTVTHSIKYGLYITDANNTILSGNHLFNNNRHFA